MMMKSSIVSEILGTLQNQTQATLYKYKDPKTNEIFFFDRTGLHKKDKQQLMYLGKATKEETEKHRSESNS